MGFGGVPLKQHIGENARKLVKTGAKNVLDFLAHAHMLTKLVQQNNQLLSQLNARIGPTKFGSWDNNNPSI